MPSEDERLITLGKDADAKFKKEVSMATSCALRQAESTVLTRRCDGSTYSAKRSRSPDSWAQNESIVSEKLKVCPLFDLVNPKYSRFYLSTRMFLFTVLAFCRGICLLHASMLHGDYCNQLLEKRLHQILVIQSPILVI